ncbi:MAG: hypothetical protein Q6356_000405 [Candidatus Wukongarchaeota archaeon]|nr:hypothetical protein [Candidatus Wukongarchaeota archaeon]
MGVTTFEGLGSKMDDFAEALLSELSARGKTIKKKETIPDGIMIQTTNSLMTNGKAEVRRVGDDLQYTYGSSLNVSAGSVLCILFLTLIAIILYFAKKGSAEDMMLSSGQSVAGRMK